MVWPGLAWLLGFWVGFDGQNASLAGSSFLGFLGHLKALRPAKAVVKIGRNLIKFTIQLFVPPGVTFKEEQSELSSLGGECTFETANTKQIASL